MFSKNHTSTINFFLGQWGLHNLLLWFEELYGMDIEHELDKKKCMQFFVKEFKNLLLANLERDKINLMRNFRWDESSIRTIDNNAVKNVSINGTGYLVNLTRSRLVEQNYYSLFR